MASVLAIISKKAFEKLAPGAKLGDVLPIDSYASSHATLARLAHGGALFLVTVRESEQLWLVAVLEDPFHEASTWCGQLNAMPVTDITDRLEHLVFESGVGLNAREGALGMSLQTPRVLTDGDIALLRGDAIAAAPAAINTEAIEARLLAMVAATPDDDAPREVLADWYLERGDIRGEHIQLALRGSSAISGREQAILGDLFAVTTSRVWDRGLLRSFELAREEAAAHDVWARAAQHPWLRVVRAIERGKAKPARYRMFVTSPLADALESITIPNKALFDRVVARPRPALRHLVLDGGPDAIRAELVDATLLPDLTQITLRTNDSTFEDIARRWTRFPRAGVDVVLRVPVHHDQRDLPIRRCVITWLRAANPRATAERASGRWNTFYRTHVDRGGLALEVITDDFSVEEIMMVQGLMPLTQLTITPLKGISIEAHVRELLDLMNTWWLGATVREFFATFPLERLVLNGAYTPLRVLARG